MWWQAGNLAGTLRLWMMSRPAEDMGPCLIVTIRAFNHGRYGFQLLNYFSLAGYRIVFYRSGGFLYRLAGYDRLILDLPGACLWTRRMAIGGGEYPWLRLGLGDEVAPPPFRVSLRLTVDLDYFSPASQSNAGAFPIPYFVHPLLGRRLPKAGAGDGKARRARVLMYGQPDLPTDSLLESHFGLISRSLVFDALTRSDLPCFVPEDFTRLLRWLGSEGSACGECCLIDSRRVWIPLDRWLEVLSAFDFFVATPGYCMPQAHNLMEAMSVGTIPILPYHHYLRPPLTPGVDCLAFRDADGAVSSVREALRLAPGEVEALRKGVTDYFASHIDPSAVVPRLFHQASATGRLTLLFNAEEFSLRRMDMEPARLQVGPIA
jgi:hypothetical protein